MAGWEPVFAVEKDHAAASSYRVNFNCPVYVGLIEDFVEELKKGRLTLPEVDAVIGGPPCQGFSLSRQDVRKKCYKAQAYIDE
jgi:DNA (cytosine-5)-methyltransferase 1